MEGERLASFEEEILRSKKHGYADDDDDDDDDKHVVDSVNRD